MKSRKWMVVLVAGGMAGLTLAGGLRAGAADSDGEDTPAALTADQVVAAVRTAVAAKPGGVLEVEGENEGGRIICDVKIQAADGKVYEVEVAVATNKAGDVEVEDGNEDAGEDKD